jgi:multidrug efflux pump subunit AcrA (membrane-fusion protein)
MIRYLTLLAAVLGVVGFLLISRQMHQPVPVPPPLVEPSLSPFPRSIGGTGLVEAVGKNVVIGPVESGSVEKVFVQIGDRVQKGDPLFQTESSAQRTMLESRKKEIGVFEANLGVALQTLNEKKDLADRMARLRVNNVNSEEDSVQAGFEYETARAKYASALADLDLSKAKVAEAQAAFDRTIVRAPKDANILQVNIHEGEFSQPFLDDGAIVIGDTSRLQLRVDIDETNASRFSPQAKALAFAKGDTGKPIPLAFSRIEPLVIPKKSLTGEKPDRVDTRVLQVIYTCDRPDWPLYVGQQVDVFIDANDAGVAGDKSPINVSSGAQPSIP